MNEYENLIFPNPFALFTNAAFEWKTKRKKNRDERERERIETLAVVSRGNKSVVQGFRYPFELRMPTVNRISIDVRWFTVRKNRVIKQNPLHLRLRVLLAYTNVLPRFNIGFQRTLLNSTLVTWMLMNFSFDIKKKRMISIPMEYKYRVKFRAISCCVSSEWKRSRNPKSRNIFQNLREIQEAINCQRSQMIYRVTLIWQGYSIHRGHPLDHLEKCSSILLASWW